MHRYHQCNMYFSPLAQQARVRLCNGITDTGWLYIGAESRVSGCVTGWPVIHRGGVQAVRLRNWKIDPGRLYIEVESSLSDCAKGLINSD